MTKAQYGTPEYYKETLQAIEQELDDDLTIGPGVKAHAYAYGRLIVSHRSCIAQLEQALENARPHCRPGCKYIQGHSGPCIERDLDAEVNAGKWGCANALDPATWPGEPEFVNVNHE